jgi:hypothetical protein
MIRERVRGQSCVSDMLRKLADGIDQAEVRIDDQKLEVAKNVVAVADAHPETAELFIVVVGVGQTALCSSDGVEFESEIVSAGV